MKPTVAVFGTLRFPPEKMVELRPHLRRLVEATYRNDGCIAYDVAEDFTAYEVSRSWSV
jgi:quinol monooxygenase YgiN